MSKTQYTPPLNITPAIVSLIAEISQATGRLSHLEHASRVVRLNRANRIRTVHGSLAIEGNTLSEEQITALLEGKRVLAPRREIQEVRNAIKAYDLMEKLNPYKIKDLFTCHQTLMYGLVDAPGVFRTGGVGIMAGKSVIHVAPPAERVPALMKQLMHWLQTSRQHPLIRGSVFHYEFEFIHPFPDGNGRLGRLWQTLILGKWQRMFFNVPIESLVFKHRKEYYASINKASAKGESSVFVSFMLKIVLDALNSSSAPEVTPYVTPEVKKMLTVLNGTMSRREIQTALGLKDEKHFRQAYQQPAVAAGLIEMTVPGKPQSRFQKYRITPKGAACIGDNK
jgi:Fic family protein